MLLYGTPYPVILPEHQVIIDKYGYINYSTLSEDNYKVIMNELKSVRVIIESKNKRGNEISNKTYINISWLFLNRKELLDLYSSPNPALIPEHQQLLTQLSSTNFNGMNEIEYNQVIENINNMKLIITSKLGQYTKLSQAMYLILFYLFTYIIYEIEMS